MTGMARYLLDTDTLIDFSKGAEPVASRVFALIESDHEVGLSPVQLTEFFYAIPPPNREMWVSFLATLTFWPISGEAAIRAGCDRYDFGRRGQQLSTDDCLTASVARSVQAMVITNNLKHYPMTDIKARSLRRDWAG